MQPLRKKLMHKIPPNSCSNICRQGKEGDKHMDVQVGDILVMKKEHPCGAKQWLVLRSGMDFRLRCTGCGHELMLPRSKAEKNIRQILRDGKQI